MSTADHHVRSEPGPDPHVHAGEHDHGGADEHGHAVPDDGADHHGHDHDGGHPDHGGNHADPDGGHAGHDHAGHDDPGHDDPGHDDPGHDHPGHDHPGHDHPGGLLGALRGVVRPHSHDHADSFDEALMVSREGTRALAVSLAGLLVTAAVELVVFTLSSSVGLLADTIHNFADAFTAVPLGLAFVVARRPPTKRYTYGFGRAEDLAGLAVVAVIAASAVVAGWEAVERLVHPHRVTDLVLVGVAGVVGFVGNELVARYRISVGRRIGSAALVADGYHARTDGFTSLAVVVGAIGVGLGWSLADPIVGLAILVAILSVLRTAARDVYRRLMDAVDPALVERVRVEASAVDGVVQVDEVRVRWIGHELRAELRLTVDRDLRVAEAHDVAEAVRHALLHHVRRLADATIHTDPSLRPDADDPHEVTAHHQMPARPEA